MFVNTVNSGDIRLLLSFLSTFAVPDLVIRGRVNLDQIVSKHMPVEKTLNKLLQYQQHYKQSQQLQRHSGRSQQIGPVSLSSMTYEWFTIGRSLVAAYFGCSQLLRPDKVMRIENTRIKSFSNTNACEILADVTTEMTHMFDLPDLANLEDKLDIVKNNSVEYLDCDPYAKTLADKYERRFRQFTGEGNKAIGHELHNKTLLIGELATDAHNADPFDVFFQRFILEGKPLKKSVFPLLLSMRMSYTLKIAEQQRLQEIYFCC